MIKLKKEQKNWIYLQQLKTVSWKFLWKRMARFWKKGFSLISDIARHKDTAIRKQTKQSQNTGQLFSFNNVRKGPTANSATTRKNSNKRNLEMSPGSAPETPVQKQAHLNSYKTAIVDNIFWEQRQKIGDCSTCFRASVIIFPFHNVNDFCIQHTLFKMSSWPLTFLNKSGQTCCRSSNGDMVKW